MSMNFEYIAIQATKIVGFILFAIGVASMVWTGFHFGITQALLLVLGLLFSAGGFFMHDMEKPSDEQLARMKEKELDSLYMPAEYRTFYKKKLQYDALHRLTDQTEGLGDFSEQKGH